MAENCANGGVICCIGFTPHDEGYEPTKGWDVSKNTHGEIWCALRDTNIRWNDPLNKKPARPQQDVKYSGVVQDLVLHGIWLISPVKKKHGIPWPPSKGFFLKQIWHLNSEKLIFQNIRDGMAKKNHRNCWDFIWNIDFSHQKSVKSHQFHPKKTKIGQPHHWKGLRQLGRVADGWQQTTRELRRGCRVWLWRSAGNTFKDHKGYYWWFTSDFMDINGDLMVI